MTPEQIDTALKIADRFVDIFYGGTVAFSAIFGAFVGTFVVKSFK